MIGSYRRTQIVQFVAGFFARHGYYPTVREVAKGVGLAPSTAYRYLLDLVALGHLQRLQVSTDRFIFALPAGDEVEHGR